ncbi:hypothetical protein SAY87_019842 [Trapa incisa]|uniref:NAB domain-containing protein n=1 Tax=Trapa incisa TaxID=236973 RepID=A0AAN7K5I4_9MYRT|nr:hypothetical protein SAY87_019842 [Trapa incisa]
MTRHQFRESIKSLVGSHTDQERHEKLKGTIEEIENKVEGILKHFRHDDQAENDQIPIEDFKREQLIEIIDDLHKKYQSLYAQYDDLTGALKNKVRGKQSQETSSTSSDSDSGSGDSKKRNSKNGNTDSVLQKIIDELKLEVERTNREVVELKTKLTVLMEEKEALLAEHQTAVSKTEEAGNTILDLRMSEMLGAADEIEMELRKKMDSITREKQILTAEKEDAANRAQEGEKASENLRNMLDVLKDENMSLQQELIATKHEVSSMKQLQESTEQKISELSYTLQTSVEENEFLTSKLSELYAEIDQAQKAIELAVAESSELKKTMEEKEREHLTLIGVHEDQNNEASAQVERLNARVAELELQLERMGSQRMHMKEQLETQTAVGDHLGKENAWLAAEISQLKELSKKREDDISDLQKQFMDYKNESLSRVEDLTTQLKSLQDDLESLQAQKAELEAKIVSNNEEASSQLGGLMDQINVLQKELGSLQDEKAGLELLLEKKSSEISEHQVQKESIELELAKNKEDQENILEKNRSLVVRLKDLEIELETMQVQKKELEGEVESLSHESEMLRGDNERQKSQVLEFEQKLESLHGHRNNLEEQLEMKARDVSEYLVQMEILKQDVESYAIHKQKMEEEKDRLTVLIKDLQNEVDSLSSKKDQLEMQIESKSQETCLLQEESKKLQDRILQLEADLTQKGDGFSALNENLRQRESEASAQIAALEGQVHILRQQLDSIQSKRDELDWQLEKERLEFSETLELKGDELGTVIENVRNIEVKLRLSNQKLRVTEQLLTEKEDIFRAAESNYQQEIGVLEERVAELSEAIDSNRKMFINISEEVSRTMVGFGSVVQKFEGEYGKHSNCILHMSADLQIAKNWVRENSSYKHHLEEEVQGLVEQLKKKTQQEWALKELLGKLEQKASIEDAEKGKLSVAIKELETKLVQLEKKLKDREEGASVMGEEKREAIRQLCIWIDYHRLRYDELKQGLLKMRASRGSAPRG